MNALCACKSLNHLEALGVALEYDRRVSNNRRNTEIETAREDLWNFLSPRILQKIDGAHNKTHCNRGGFSTLPTWLPNWFQIMRPIWDRRWL